LPDAVRERLARLAADQRAAATAPPGPVLCVAPAGSGKTTTLVARLAWRVALGVDPGTICALTFNRRAATELRERAELALGELGVTPGNVFVSTFHALGRAILAEAGMDVARIVDRTIVLEHLAGGPLPAEAARWLDDAFTRLKLDPERGPPSTDTSTHQAFAEYEAHLSASGSIDLDDLVARAVPALVADEGLLGRWRARAAVLFVDEAQDLDRTQLELALLLTGERRDIFLVGDDDQTIYAWRLADVRRVLGLAARLPGLRRVDLETNHRCAPEIVRRAARLVAHNRERFAKTIRPSPAATGSVTLLPDCGDAVARARLLLAEWPPRDPHGRPASTRAILARTNGELVPYAAVALEAGIAYRVESDGLLLEEKLLLDAVDRAAVKARRAAHDGDLTAPFLPSLAAAASDLGLEAGLTGSLLAWAAPFRDLVAFREALLARRATRERLAHGGDADTSPLTGPPTAGGAAPTDAAGLLTLATFHGTKGLEWDHVVCLGHDEGVFPSARALRDAVDPARVLEEERRLAYVAWTRARQTLTLVYDPDAPSRFLREAFDPGELSW
jgi:DNA helicase-2/ATP-dependent DNA helicase PcrA